MSTSRHRDANFRTFTKLGAAAWGVVVAALLVGIAQSSSSDVRRMEAVGAEPIRADTPIEAPLRDAALKRALGDAVVRVAGDLLAPEARDGRFGAPVVPGFGSPPADPLDSDPRTPEEKLQDRLVAALGADPLDYAVRFRILEDRGERPALFVEDPEIESEYVIVVEVFVDTERVRRRLDRQGFALLPSGEGAQVRIRLELLDVDRFAAYEMVRLALSADSRVHSVVPVEMERGRVVLEVDSAHQPEALLERLYQVVPAEIEIEPIAIDEGGLSLRVRLHEDPAGAGNVAAPGD